MGGGWEQQQQRSVRERLGRGHSRQTGWSSRQQWQQWQAFQSIAAGTGICTDSRYAARRAARQRTPAATLVLRSASSSVVLPWSTCPITVTTAGRGTASASCRASLPPRLPAASTANFPNSRAASSAASGDTRSCRELHCSPSSASTSSTRSSGASAGADGGEVPVSGLAGRQAGT